MIDDAIEITLKKRNEYPPENLTSQDIFYVQITRVHEMFKSLASYADEIVQQEQVPTKAAQILLDISQIVLVRQSMFTFYVLPTKSTICVEISDFPFSIFYAYVFVPLCRPFCTRYLNSVNKKRTSSNCPPIR